MATPTPEEPFGITPVYDILLRGSEQTPVGLCHLFIATAAQLTHLHYSDNSVKLIKSRLKILADNGYAQEDWTPTRRLRSPYHYMLGTKGVEYLRDVGLDIPDSFRASKEVGKSYLHIQHALELNDIIIAAALLKQHATYYSLVAFQHERELARNPYHTLWQGHKFGLVPDAFLDFREALPDGRQRRIPVLLEHDRNTEERRQFRRKVRAYITLLKSEAYKERFKVNSITIAFTTFSGEKRRDKLREWTKQELEGEPKHLAAYFMFTAQLQPPEPRRLWLEPCWYTSDMEDEPIALLTGE